MSDKGLILQGVHISYIYMYYVLVFSTVNVYWFVILKIILHETHVKSCTLEFKIVRCSVL